MSIEKPKDERRELYDKFRAGLKGGDETSSFYDEDDLIDIYDQAADLEDEYVKIEVLLTGSRLYPDSEALAARKGYLFFAYDLQDGVTDTIRRRSTGSLLWKVLEMRAAEAKSSDETVARLRELLEAENDLDDETVIQVVDLASAAGAYEWLKENESFLRTKTTYLPTLLYELHVVAIINDDRPFAIAKLEELTEIDPFTADYWAILAEEQLNSDNIDAAISAADYALAISSDHPGAIIAKARALTRTESRPQEVIDLIEPVIDDKLSDPSVAEMYVAALIHVGRQDTAEKFLTEFNDRNPWDRSAVNLLLLLEHPEISVLLDRYYSYDTEHSESEWTEWALTHYNSGGYRQAAMILGCLYRQQGLSIENEILYYSTLYAAEFYTALAAMLDDMIKNHLERLTPELVMAGILSVFRTKGKTAARHALERVMKIHPLEQTSRWGIDNTLKAIGYSSMFGMLTKILETSDRVNIDDIDPFIAPKPIRH